jgi:glycosyltransferase involved in cell wall biosynthesis
MLPRVLAIIPCHNEVDSIGPLLREFERDAPFCDVLVVDDGSSDGTHAAVDGSARCARLPTNLGIGGAVQTGIKFAAANGYDYCIQIDGDGQHPPSEILGLLQHAQRTGSAIAIGSRYLERKGFQSSPLRRLGGQLIGGALGLLFGGKRVSDPTSGMRLMDRRAIQLFSAHYPLDYPEPISVGWALAQGLPVSEAQVEMRSRVAGQSSIRLLRTASYMVRVIFYISLSKIMLLPTPRR